MKLRRVGRSSAVLALLFGASLGAAPDPGAPFAGRWDAVVVANGVDVPFQFEIAADGTALKGSFFNGERRITSRAGTVDGDTLVLPFDQYAAKLHVSLRDSQLTGEYQRARGGPLPVRAVRARQTAAANVKAPSIDGTWIVQAKSSKGETAWRFIAKQKGAQVSATILRVDGDTGTLTGSYRDGRFVLSHFSGARPLLLEVTPAADGTIVLKQNGKTELAPRARTRRRRRPSARPPIRRITPASRTRPNRFASAFPISQGKIVSNTDARFAGKVVLLNISGSWCPNCHDEAPFLASLYKKYRGKGFEIVTLSFEEADQLANPTRLRAFIETYGLEYTVLLPGVPDQLEQKVPQAVNLNAFPTTFLLGRDGRVRAVHAGFPSPGSGDFYTKAERDITREVERLIAERSPGTH